MHFSFPENSIENYIFGEDVESCTVFVTQTNSDGEITGTAIHTLPADSAQECEDIVETVTTLYRIGVLKMR